MASTPGYNALRAWLEQHELEEYTNGLVEAGYSSMRFLVAATLDDIEEAMQEVSMKKGHARVFTDAWAALMANDNSGTPRITHEHNASRVFAALPDVGKEPSVDGVGVRKQSQKIKDRVHQDTHTHAHTHQMQMQATLQHRASGRGESPPRQGYLTAFNIEERESLLPAPKTRTLPSDPVQIAAPIAQRLQQSESVLKPEEQNDDPQSQPWLWKDTPENREALSDLYQMIDKNESGGISFTELLHMLTNLGEDVSDELVEDMITLVDVDGNREIDLEEFCNILCGSHPFVTSATGGPQSTFSKRTKADGEPVQPGLSERQKFRLKQKFAQKGTGPTRYCNEEVRSSQ